MTAALLDLPSLRDVLRKLPRHGAGLYRDLIKLKDYEFIANYRNLFKAFDMQREAVIAARKKINPNAGESGVGSDTSRAPNHANEIRNDLEALAALRIATLETDPGHEIDPYNVTIQ